MHAHNPCKEASFLEANKSTPGGAHDSAFYASAPCVVGAVGKPLFDVFAPVADVLAESVSARPPPVGAPLTHSREWDLQPVRDLLGRKQTLGFKLRGYGTLTIHMG